MHREPILTTCGGAVLILHIDHHCLEDLLFMQGLARVFAQAGSGLPPCLIVHGSGERAERVLEGEGLFVERSEGVLQVETPEARALVNRAVEEENRRIVATLTDAVVAAVGVPGTGRGLLRVDAGGAVRAHRAEWLVDLARKRVVPVVAALAAGPAAGEAREVGVTEVVIALAKALEKQVVQAVFFTKDARPGVFVDGVLADALPASAVPRAGVAGTPEAVRRVAAQAGRVLLTSPLGLTRPAGPQGTFVVAE